MNNSDFDWKTADQLISRFWTGEMIDFYADLDRTSHWKSPDRLVNLLEYELPQVLERTSDPEYYKDAVNGLKKMCSEAGYQPSESFYAFMLEEEKERQENFRKGALESTADRLARLAAANDRLEPINTDSFYYVAYGDRDIVTVKDPKKAEFAFNVLRCMNGKVFVSGLVDDELFDADKLVLCDENDALPNPEPDPELMDAFLEDETTKECLTVRSYDENGRPQDAYAPKTTNRQKAADLYHFLQHGLDDRVWLSVKNCDGELKKIRTENMYLVNEDGRVKSVQEEPGWADTKPFSYKEDSSYEKDSSHEEDSRFSASTNNNYDDDDYKNKLYDMAVMRDENSDYVRVFFAQPVSYQRKMELEGADLSCFQLEWVDDHRGTGYILHEKDQALSDEDDFAAAVANIPANGPGLEQ